MTSDLAECMDLLRGVSDEWLAEVTETALSLCRWSDDSGADVTRIVVDRALCLERSGMRFRASLAVAVAMTYPELAIPVESRLLLRSLCALSAQWILESRD